MKPVWKTEHSHKYLTFVDITMSFERIVAIFITISLAVLSTALPRPQPDTSVFSHELKD